MNGPLPKNRNQARARATQTWRPALPVSPKEIADTLIKRYFSSLFTDDNPVLPSIPSLPNNNNDNNYAPRSISDLDNLSLCKPVLDAEIELAVFQLGPCKPPGPDGFSGIFYQKHWPTIKPDICHGIREFFDGGAPLPKDLNKTNIVHVPKKKPGRFRPITLCNFAYKIVAKVLANRLEPLLQNIDSLSQSALVSGGQIQDNIIVAHEVFHYMKNKKKGPKGFMAIKLDLDKAFHRVRWCFLKSEMEKMGFCNTWIGWIMDCITSVEYNVVANGSQIASISPSRGLRHGDPLSPYLFLIVANGLSSMISEAISRKTLSGLRIRNRGPNLSHRLVADDSLIFLEATVSNCHVIMEVLHFFGLASGETVNFRKSEIFFSPNTSPDLQNQILQEMGMSSMTDAAKYFGLPTHWTKSKQQALAFVRDRILSETQGWKKCLLAEAGSEILIRSVAQGIPAYPMTCFKFSISLCKQLSSIINCFGCGEKDCGSKSHQCKWDSMASEKFQGGMGYRNFASFNKALLGKQFWRMLKNPKSLWAQVLKASYFPTSNPMEAKRGASPSWVWSSLLEGRDLIKKGLVWKLGNGESINIWEDKWLFSNHQLITLGPRPTNNCPSLVKDLFCPNSKSWNLNLLHSLFPSHICSIITSTPITSTNQNDSFIWDHDPSGIYTVKSGYHLATTSSRHSGPSSSSFTTSVNTWKTIGTLPCNPRIRHFILRVLKNAIASKENLFKRKCSRSPLCPICHLEVETIEHSLFRCSWTHSIWSNCGLSFHDPIQSIVSAAKWFDNLVNPPSPLSKASLALIAQICWGIWRRRNDYIFSNLTPDPTSTLKAALTAEGDYLRAVYAHLNPRDTHALVDSKATSWQRPPLGFWKFHCGAAFNPSSKHAAFAVIAWDPSGKVREINYGRINLGSALAAEAWTIRVACSMAGSLQIPQAIFETYCSRLVKLLSNDSASICSVRDSMLEDMKSLCNPFVAKFSWRDRKANQCANWVAKKCNRNRLPPPSLSALPSEVCNLVQLELSCAMQ